MTKKHSSSLKTNQAKTDDIKQFNIFYQSLSKLNPLNTITENNFFIALKENPNADKLRVLILKFSYGYFIKKY